MRLMLRRESHPREAAVTGLILLLFLACICAFFVQRGRRKMGLGTPGRMLIMVIVGFALIVLVAWVARQ